jgi:hypothetical protein
LTVQLASFCIRLENYDQAQQLLQITACPLCAIQTRAPTARSP